MITVVNKYKHSSTKNDVYIGRGSVLGNPYTHVKNKSTKADYTVDTRQESIQCYDKWLRSKIAQGNNPVCDELNRLYQLSKNQNLFLVCFCAPKSCHGDTIKQVIEEKT